MTFDVEYVRSQFPALKSTVNGCPVVFFDGPGGTQVPQRVIDRMVEYLVRHNSNTHGAFPWTIETDEIIFNAREVFADYFNSSPKEVAFCHNSTTISFKLAQAIARDLRPGDEVIVTDIDHEANRGPWQLLAERGVVVKSVKVNTDTCTLDMRDYAAKRTDRTRVVAFNYASNAVGTISDAKEIIRLAKEVGAFTIVDAVHYALHGVIDVKDLGTDFLFCSAYKFFGPHLGVLYGREEKMLGVRTLKVGAQEETSPGRFETGTLNHEGIAGAAEAVEFLADIGVHHRGKIADPPMGCSERRRNIIEGVQAMEAHEQPLADYFREQLRQIDGLTIYGPPSGRPRTSTISFALRGIHPEKVATLLGRKGIFVWDGNFYAVQLVKSLGLSDSGGLVRIGLAPYNTKEEIERALDEIRVIAAGKR